MTINIPSAVRAAMANEGTGNRESAARRQPPHARANFSMELQSF